MPTKIRSGYQRKIIDWLADGGGTISEASKSVGLRLSHASATFKKLRTEGLVIVDESEHQRGSIQRLTPKGWSRLESDELSRLDSINLNKIPENAEGCLLARDGPMLLLGYLKEPTNEGFILPSKPIPSDEFNTTNSSGNIGEGENWSWAVARENGIRWFSIPELKPIQKQSKNAIPEGITDWNVKEEKIGLIRARLLDPDKSFSLSVGSWFAPIPKSAKPKLPTLLHEDYCWTLATFHDNKHKIKPQQPVIAEMDRRLGINLLLEAAACDGIIIGEMGLLSKKNNSLPISILEHWINRIHPKLPEKSQTSRLNFLLGELGFSNRSRKKRRTSGEQATWSKFKLDWANSNWDIDSNNKELFFDNSQLRKNALLSIIDWSMKNSKGVPLSIQWPRNVDLTETDSENILRYPALRILIIEKWNGAKPALFLKESKTSSLPIMDLFLDRGVVLPISVEISDLNTITPVIEENITIPENLKDLLKKSNIEIIEKSPEFENLIYCCKQFPSGNEFEANKLEFDYPLESWIITPSNLRWLRWQRISKRIDPHWVELLPPELIPLEEIGAIALMAPNKWKENARKILSSKLQINPDSSLNIRKILLKGNLNEKAWWFSCLITSSPWLAPSIRINLVKVGLQPWIELNQKLSLGNFTEVLNILNWMQNLNEIDDGWISSLSKHNLENKDSEVFLWSILISRFQNKTSIQFENISRIVTTFDINWWAPLAEEFLNICIESNEGRSWLESINISWCAAILREPNEEHHIPGVGIVKHQGCSNNLLDNLEQVLSRLDTSKESKGIMQLIDLKNSLSYIKNGISPKKGEVHNHSGWLSQPLEFWPQTNALIDEFGDENISRRLYLRKSGFHPELKKSLQSKLS